MEEQELNKTVAYQFGEDFAKLLCYFEGKKAFAEKGSEEPYYFFLDRDEIKEQTDITYSPQTFLVESMERNGFIKVIKFNSRKYVTVCEDLVYSSH
jgi:hypothetical protein